MSKKIYIPGRLQNAAVDSEGNRLPVTGAEDIDAGEGKSQQQVNKDVDDTLTLHQQEINALDGQNYVTVTAYSSLPATGAVNTIYRVSSYDGTQVDATKYSEYAWNGSAYVLLDVKTQVGEVFDISQYRAVGGTLATFDDLADALDSGNNVPSGLRKGGMSVKFVQSSDNRYVQYRLMANEWSVDTDDWAIADDGVYVDNIEYIEVHTDSENKVLYGVKKDGNFHFGTGVPSQISNVLNTKVDKVDGMSLIDEDYAFSKYVIESPEYLCVEIDSSGKILSGTRRDGSHYSYNVESNTLNTFTSNPEKITEETDIRGRLLARRARSGEAVEDVGIVAPKISLEDNDIYSLEDVEERGEVLIDSEGKILAYRDADGVKHENVGIESPVAKIGILNLKEAGIKKLIEDLYKNIASDDILYLNPEVEVLPKLGNLKRRYVSYGGAINDQAPVLCLLHCSDVHSDNNNILRIKEFRDHYSSYIKDVLDTGDFIGGSWRDGLPSSTSQVSDFIRIIGNHDTRNLMGTSPNYYWELVGQKDCYDVVLKDYIGNWGVVQPENAATEGYCYFYKDYSDERVRIICLDGEHWNDTELTWFQNVLSDAKTLGLHVICAVHRPPFYINPIGGNTFDSIDFPHLPFADPIDGAVEAVNRFMAVEDNVSGKFICWLCGHIHQDCMGLGRDEDTANQLIVSIATAGVAPATIYSEMYRAVGDKSQDCFNIVGIDTNTKDLKIIRIGAQYDRHMRKRDTLCWNYGTNTLTYCG